jgi:sn-glycerol 3-phosphate transport system ATP-binding protein
VPGVEIKHLSKAFNGTPAVVDVTLAAAHGQLLVLLGPSGCGKSTTLRMIAGLELPDQGRIVIGDRDVTDVPAADRRIAMVFQSYALFPHLNVAENIVFGLKVRGIARVERDERLRRVAELVGLEPYLARKPAELSGGQRQRVALARAIIAEAPVCLMDEPLSNLDAKLRQEMRVEIRALQQRLGMTMIYVTHDQTEAMTMADQVALMRDGRVEQMGTPADLYERPATAFTARFIGAPAMNVLPAELLPSPLRMGHAPEDQIGIRPESVALRHDGVGIPVTVTSIEYLGAETIVTGAFAGTSVVARLPGRYAGAIGDTASATWDPRHACIFDGATGRRRSVTSTHQIGSLTA